jgi:hypothetical protein
VPSALKTSGPGVNRPPTVAGDFGVSVPSAATSNCAIEPGFWATGTYALAPSRL